MKVVVIGGTGLVGSKIVVDVANSPSFEDGPAWDFFTTATGNVLSTAESADVSHKLHGLAHRQRTGSGPVTRRRNAIKETDHDC
jgi:hypothetical protein